MGYVSFLECQCMCGIWIQILTNILMDDHVVSVWFRDFNEVEDRQRANVFWWLICSSYPNMSLYNLSFSMLSPLLDSVIWCNLKLRDVVIIPEQFIATKLQTESPHWQGQSYDGWRLTYGGYDFLALRVTWWWRGWEEQWGSCVQNGDNRQPC